MSHDLSSSDLEFIAEQEESFSEFFKLLKEVSHFKVGDYLIGSQKKEFWSDDTYYPIVDYKNNRVKYKVMHISETGLPYVKKINNRGKPEGIIIPMISFNDNNSDMMWTPYIDIKFEVDPDFIDSIILQENNFDPVAKQRMQSDLRKEILTYNKKHSLSFEDEDECLIYFKSLKSGSIVWKNNSTYLIYDSMVTLPSLFYYVKGKLKGQPLPPLIQLKFITKTGKILLYDISTICAMKLFSSQPRSLKELDKI